MILSYLNIFKPSARKTRVKATITANHSAGSYGQPVIVLEDDGSLDLMAWVAMGCQAVQATKKERTELQKIGLL